jgi:uncharacterized protein (DUF302 family)
MTGHIKISALTLFVCLALFSQPGHASGKNGLIVREMGVAWTEAWPKLQTAITKNRMGVVSRASASSGAKSRAITIPGNMVIGVFRNDFAVRMLAASIEAGIEAPLRFYLTETSAGQTRLSYRLPSITFAPYGGGDLHAMAKELDAIFARIADEAVK